MTYVITDACTKDEACVAVCPVDCIQSNDQSAMMFINPDECIDCGACASECEHSALFAEGDVPADKKQFAQVNAAFFQN
jgi:NAD-dependent dihydropyrimidine dehydrogenase PreA subunit